ncbi:serine hydrolase [Nocardia sp. NPDC051570]|uniref:serine hydrolase n=1 Tax=Nocardia sp. NPDC051570 TaxID=3364324 RepID=UPI003789EC0B
MLLGGAAALVAPAATTYAAPGLAGKALAATYNGVTTGSGGRWHSCVTDLMSANPVPVVDHDADFVIEGASVQKLAVGVALLGAVDEGRLSLHDTVELNADILAPGSGIYHRQTVYGDRLTLSNVLVAMLQVSDNTAVRLIGSKLPGTEINSILAAKGFEKTRVEPLPGNPHRFWLGVTTPREINTLLCKLVTGTLLTPASTQTMLRILTWPSVGYVDGVRRSMSSLERARIATKYGANEDKRHEAGVLFDANGAPQLVYAYFADQAPDPDNYGATNPIVQAHAVLGRAMLDEYTYLSPLSALIDPQAINRNIAAGAAR